MKTNKSSIFMILIMIMVFLTLANFVKAEQDKCYVRDKEVPCPGNNQIQEQKTDVIIPPDNTNYEQNMLLILPFLLMVACLIILSLLKTKIFGKTLKEYTVPIWYYIIGVVLVVFSQYYIALPLSNKFPFILNLTQALWALMVAFSVIKLTVFYNFNFKNVLFLGVLYSFIIHGLKAFVFRVFLFPYSGTSTQVLEKIISKFLYGSFLVMIIVIILGLIFIKLKNNPEVRESSKWL